MMSALQRYELLGMQEEAVECLASSSRYKEAKEKALSIPDFETNPKLLCLFGDMT